MGSNPTQCMDVCVRLFCVCAVLCAGSGFATGWSPVQEVLPTVQKIKKLKKRCRAIAQAVSRWLPTAEARVRTRVWSCGIWVDKMGLGQVFSQYFGFPCQFSSHQLLHNHHHHHHHHLIIRGCYNKPIVAAVPSGLSLTRLRIIKKTANAAKVQQKAVQP
jgi:hypothetical protein